MNITKFLVFTLIYFLVFNHNLIGQKNEKIKYKADELEYLKINKDPVRKLKFNVEFVQGKTKIKSKLSGQISFLILFIIIIGLIVYSINDLLFS